MLLDEHPEDCQWRERDTFDQLCGANSELVLFGAGGLGRKVLAALRSECIQPLAFADNKLAGQTIDGIEVLSPAVAAQRYGREATFVVTIWAAWADTMHEQIESLRALGCVSVIPFIPLLWKLPHLLPHTQIDLPSHVLAQKEEIRLCFQLWSDDDSRREFMAQLRWRLFGDFDSLQPPVTRQYWQVDLIHPAPHTVFADAGAFDGDTLEQFVSFTDGSFRAAYAFEPDAQNLRVLRARVDAMPGQIRARIHVFENAVAESEYEMPFQSGAGEGSSLGSGKDRVRCVALDDVLPEPPDLIKYDIEGFELQGLCGSRRLIAEHTPSLAVCAYHLQDHLWRIPLLIHSINPSYRFYLRPHGQIWETVCYAVP